MPIDSLMIWRARIGALKIPEPTSPEQTRELGVFGAAIGAQLGKFVNHNHVTRNLQSALFHFSLEMQCLRTVDFLG
ncbi:hypothetical protein EV182_007205, partial [Spiromyces aspiralis]